MDEFTELDDPQFLEERRKAREEIERTPAGEQSAELTARYQRLTEEFLRRAAAAWAKAS
jgi:hypothetical protein